MVTTATRTDAPTARHIGAMAIVHRYVAVSAVAGLNPVPGLDVAVLGVVHVGLIRDLTHHYGSKFSDHAARNILIAVAASIVPGAIGSVLGRRALSALPLIPGAGLFTMAAFSASVSYGLGLIVVRHFEAGGTLDSFDVKHLHTPFARSSA